MQEHFSNFQEKIWKTLSKYEVNQVLKPKSQTYPKIIRQNQAKPLPTRLTTTIK